ncbi:MAG: hypothetical protein JW786_00325 [Desulfobacterales bacterium]|nr:hypothetical protein [Desulfobacterales bacterium]
MRELRRIDIQTLKNQRFQLEQMLAIELVATFDKEDTLIVPLRKMAKRALDDMNNMKEMVILDACKEEKMLNIWQTKGTLAHIGNQYQSLKAAECSDIIRLYGMVVEQLGKTGGSGAQIDTLKKTYRPAPMTDFQGKDMIWDPDRYRVRGKKQVQIPEWHKLWQEEAHVHGIDFKQAGKGVEPKSSILSWSTVRKIDNAFGLPVGADISGTTADSLFFVERFARRCKIPYDPIYQLLALATLVSARHHALLEVALTMTLNKVTTYSIGFYSTLYPAGDINHLYQHPARGKIKGILTQYEKHDFNKHILVYFDPTKKGSEEILGGYLFENEGEIARFKDLATTGKDFIWRFVTFPPEPTKVRIKRMMGHYGLIAPE